MRGQEPRQGECIPLCLSVGAIAARRGSRCLEASAQGGLGPATLSAETLGKTFPLPYLTSRSHSIFHSIGLCAHSALRTLWSCGGSKWALEQNFGTASVGGGQLVVASMPRSAGEQRRSLKLVNQADLSYF